MSSDEECTTKGRKLLKRVREYRAQRTIGVVSFHRKQNASSIRPLAASFTWCIPIGGVAIDTECSFSWGGLLVNGPFLLSQRLLFRTKFGCRQDFALLSPGKTETLSHSLSLFVFVCNYTPRFLQIVHVNCYLVSLVLVRNLWMSEERRCV